MKAVMMSIKPEWVNEILNGRKKMEVRKTEPRLRTPFRVYIYCTNSGRPLVYGQLNAYCPEEYQQTYGYSRKQAEKIWEVLNGKVVAEFICNNIEFIKNEGFTYENTKRLRKLTCLSMDEIASYIGDTNIGGYAWNIRDLQIYDEPKMLSEFNMKRPPQSWCYVEELK